MKNQAIPIARPLSGSDFREGFGSSGTLSCGKGSEVRVPVSRGVSRIHRVNTRLCIKRNGFTSCCN